MIRIPNIGQSHTVFFIKAKALSGDELSAIMVAIARDMLIVNARRKPPRKETTESNKYATSRKKRSSKGMARTKCFYVASHIHGSRGKFERFRDET
jgi:hypothetical protein